MAIATVPSGEATDGGPARLVVRGPSWRDPRLHVAGTLLGVQVLGQTVLDFEISIAQILICLLTCAAIEVGIGVARDRVLGWPASALLTGNGVALILRVNGTEHGDWWSTRGWGLFASCAAVSLLSKYAIRVGDRHLFNPSNLGLVVWFLVFGTGRINPLDFWWAPWGGALAATYALLLVGGLSLLRRLRLGAPVVVFLAVLAAGLGGLAAGGHGIDARWHVGPVEGMDYWRTIVTSPEVLIFAFFMLTDVRTMPRGSVGRTVYAGIVAASSVLFMASQGSEFGTKVGLLAGLLVGCALRPAIDRWCPAAGGADDRLGAWWRGHALATAAAVALAGLGVAAAAGTAPAPASRPAAPRAVGERPAVVLAADEQPTVEVDVGDGPLAATVDQGVAEDLVEDVVAGLVIEADALAAGDADLAATAVTGARRRWVDEQLARPAGERTVDRYRFTAATVTTIRDPGDPQAVPRMGVILRGTVAALTVDLTVTVEEAGGTWLIADVVGP